MKEVSKGNYELYIGNHLVKGKAVDLPKALILTEKSIDENGSLQFNIKSIIRKKILFSGRPTPLRLNQQQPLRPSKLRKLN